MSERSLPGGFKAVAQPRAGARPQEFKSRTVATWLYVIVFLAMFLVVFGGFVRLSRAGLSIVEWNPISGVIPPIGEQAWEQEFLKYQQTPEFQRVNFNMTLDGYKRIFYIEWLHRLIARLAGLVVVVPLAYFLIKGAIPWRRSGWFFAITLLFAFQGFLGWYMVSSGLVDRPSVSHYRLTAHLLLALTLLALALWKGLNVDPRIPPATVRLGGSAQSRLALFLLAVLVVQIAYGGLVAGLRAGHASNTWPLMFGYLLPPGLLSAVQPWWENLLSTAATVHYVHRWFAFIVLAVGLALCVLAWRQGADHSTQRGILVLLALVAVQIGLGVAVIWLGVPLFLALLHQATGLLLFITALFLNHRLLRA